MNKTTKAMETIEVSRGDFFEVCVSYCAIAENGNGDKRTELYLVDAMSFTEAEEMTIKAIAPFVQSGGELFVKSIKRVNVAELFQADGDRYYKVKVAFISIDEKTAREKRISHLMIAQANSIEQARKLVESKMNGTLATYVIEELKETKIMDVLGLK